MKSRSKAVTKDKKGSDGKAAPLTSMLRVCKVLYDFAELRDFVNQHDEDLCRDEAVQEDDKKISQNPDNLVKFVKTGNVITRHCNESKRHLQSTLIKKPIILKEILEFVRENRNLIRVDANDNFKLRRLEDRLESPDEFRKLKIENDFQMLLDRKFDAEIWEFDDEFDNEELMFGIAVNRTERRIVCVFRGSVSGGNDWSTNYKLYRTKLEDVKDTKTDLGLGEFGNIGLHYGFANYLFNDTWTRDGQPSKFEQIVEILKEIRTKRDRNGYKYKDYDIFVTGHSLGGALSQLLSFALAGSTITRDEFPRAVTAITFGSPKVGNGVWLREYQYLENQGYLRHIRVSNQGDMVCVVPNIPFGYTQTGVNIHLFPAKKAAVTYDNERSLVSSLACNSPGNVHGLECYYERLIGNDRNRRIMKRSVEDFYRKYATPKNTVKSIIAEYDDYGFTTDSDKSLYKDFFSS